MTRKGYKQTEEHKRKIAEALKGNKNGMNSPGFSGRKHSDKSKARISESLKEHGPNAGTFKTGEMSEIQKARWQTEEYADSVRKGLKKAFSDPELRARIAANTRRQWKENKAYRDMMLPKLMEMASDNTVYKSGHHQSPKAGRVHYRSSYELECYQQLDQDPEVLSYEVETISIPYVYEGIERTYIPDIKVIYIDEDWEVIEIKPDSLTEDPQNAAKFTAARELFGDRFIILTEKELYNEPI